MDFTCYDDGSSYTHDDYKYHRGTYSNQRSTYNQSNNQHGGTNNQHDDNCGEFGDITDEHNTQEETSIYQWLIEQDDLLTLIGQTYSSLENYLYEQALPFLNKQEAQINFLTLILNQFD